MDSMHIKDAAHNNNDVVGTYKRYFVVHHSGNFKVVKYMKSVQACHKLFGEVVYTI